MSAVLGLVGLLGRRVPRGALRCRPSSRTTSGSTRRRPSGVLALVVVVLTAAALGQTLLLLLARRVRESVPGPRRPRARLRRSASWRCSRHPCSSLWVVAGAVRVGGPPGVRELVSRSAVVAAVDELVPPSAGRLVDEADRGPRPRWLPAGLRGARSRADHAGRGTRREPRAATRRWRPRWTRWSTCAPSPAPAAPRRSAAAGSSPRGTSPPTRTSSPARDDVRVSVRGTGRRA